MTNITLGFNIGWLERGSKQNYRTGSILPAIAKNLKSFLVS